MKQFLLSTAFLLFTFIGFGQCPTESGIGFVTQSELDAFLVNYPNCTELRNVYIFGEGITDLSPLNQITHINGNFEIVSTSLTSLNGLNSLIQAGDSVTDHFKIEFNDLLLSLNGLNNLEHIEGILQITSNSVLPNLQGLESLTSMNNYLHIYQNPVLENLSGLENLTTISGMIFASNQSLIGFEQLESLETVVERISIQDNNFITSLAGFESLQSLSLSFTLSDNDLLNDISGFANLDSNFVFGVKITNNSNLSECSIQAVCDNVDNPNLIYFDIENNGTGCSSVAEVAFQCGIVDIPDNNFLNALLNYTPTIDTNTDGNIQFDEAEAFTGNLNVAGNVISDFTGLEAFINSTGFDGSGNFISELSLEENTAVTSVDFSNNPDLRKVFLKNGNNTAITNFNGVDCPSLEFICVDDVAFAEANFTSIDSHVVFVEDCEILAVEDFNLADAVSVFPNPVSETLTISTTSNINFTKAEIYSINGQKLVETSATQINLSDFSTGIYFVKVISAQGSITKKIIKE